MEGTNRTAWLDGYVGATVIQGDEVYTIFVGAMPPVSLTSLVFTPDNTPKGEVIGRVTGYVETDFIYLILDGDFGSSRTGYLRFASPGAAQPGIPITVERGGLDVFDFTPPFGLSVKEWKAVLYIAAVAFAVWAIGSLARDE